MADSKMKFNMQDKVKTMLTKLSEGHYGAFLVASALYMGDFSHAVQLDLIGCYGHRIWLLYEKVCMKSIPLMAEVLNMWEDGVIPIQLLDDAIDTDYRLNIRMYKDLAKREGKVRTQEQTGVGS